MRNWFSCKASYEKMQEDGSQKKVSEEYLVDALSFTEAEARIIYELSSMVRGEFQITKISKSRIAELHDFPDGDAWYLCKVAIIMYDERTNKEKKSVSQMLIMASDVKDAYDKANQKMTGSMADYTIPSISISPILDVFEYDPNIKLNSNPQTQNENIGDNNVEKIEEAKELETVENFEEIDTYEN